MKAKEFIAQWWLGLLLAAVVVAPILLSPRRDHARSSEEETLVIITPHNEAIRYEFGRGFRDWYRSRTGREVRVDWRSPGGTSEITRYLAGEYFAAFQNHWTNNLRRAWNPAVEKAYANGKVTLDDTPEDDTLEQQARRAFLESSVSSRIDLFFGGGAFDYQLQAAAGRLVDSGFIRENPALFNDKAIPQTLGGEPFWDKDGRWIGTCLGAFGICSNEDGLRRIGIPTPPTTWAELADPRFFHEIALANPTQSSSVTKAFEMLIQQQMLAAVHRLPPGASAPDQTAAIAAGWEKALNLIQRISANARYFTDASTKIALDVAAGEASAGMTIDFFGRFESEAVRQPDGHSRLHYVDAIGGTSAGADPIGLLRGAPNAVAAKEFIAFAMSPEGQKLWNWKVGTPDGPHRYALRRLPIRPDLYAPEFVHFRSDPGVNPYTLSSSFTYNEKWTGPLFKQISFIVRVMCIDSHKELQDAWRELAQRGFPESAVAVLENVQPVNYAAANGRIKAALADTKIVEVQLAKELADHFRQQYRQAAALAARSN
jgi:ABC-type Fe3+ transport system substrate-binding protein